MSPISRLSAPALMLAAALALAACESSEDRAERHYASALSLLEDGDVDRALVEFRNVFKYNGFHKEARQAYADLQLERGLVSEAYGQYLRLIEQYPDTPEVRRTLAELAIGRGDWAEAERHGRAAIGFLPDDPQVRAIAAALDYRDAVLAEEEAARAAAADRAREVLAALPDNRVARSVVIDQLMTGPDPQAAMPVIEEGLDRDPDAPDLNGLKLRLLIEAEDVEGLGAQLQEMSERFPDNEEVRAALIRWYLVRGDYAGAEAYLRDLAGPMDADPAGHVTVVQLLQSAYGPDAAVAELDRLIAANAGAANADLYGALRATIAFEGGRRTEAIAEMETILQAAGTSDQTRRIKVMLARMLEATGNAVGARARVEEVLAEDPSHVEALKLRAGWRIDGDDPGAAIVDLRTALGQSPRDAEALTLMARAHERDGSPELAGERLALAVEVSGSAPAESLRYARFLARDGRLGPAVSVLVDARRVSPGDADVLGELAGLYLRQQDWSRAEEVIGTLESLPGADAGAQAAALRTALLQGQDRVAESLSFLEAQVAEGAGDNNAVAMVVQTHLRAGDPGAARAYLDGVLADRPDDPGLRMLSGTLHGLTGDMAAAEEVLRGVIADLPQAEAPVRMLYGLLAASDQADRAAEVLDAGLAAQPASGMLRWMKAGELERAGDVEGAIAVYEALYEEDSNNVVIANNLASLITTHRDDAESLERAFAIARRLRGQDVPAFQDTYGWIESRRGNHAEALTHLEPAAAGLPGDALVQYHLGMTYAALERTAEAAEVLRRALDLAGDSDLPQFARAREVLDGLAAD